MGQSGERILSSHITKYIIKNVDALVGQNSQGSLYQVYSAYTEGFGLISMFARLTML